jgi:hypothetical protein
MKQELALTTLLFSILASTLPHVAAQTQEAESDTMAVIAEDDFEENRGQWEWLDPTSWQYTLADERGVMSQYVRASSYEPPHRSPFHVALLKDHVVGDFELTASVKSTVDDYGHRDVCLFFGYVDPAHYYYVHIGKKTDPHCNQIFIVNGEDRKAISLTTTEGTPWTEDWHRVKLMRKADTGLIEVFFDNFDKPIMTAQDKTFPAGRVGVGSFDDTADWDDFELRGVPATLDEPLKDPEAE